MSRTRCVDAKSARRPFACQPNPVASFLDRFPKAGGGKRRDVFSLVRHRPDLAKPWPAIQVTPGAADANTLSTERRTSPPALLHRQQEGPFGDGAVFG